MFYVMHYIHKFWSIICPLAIRCYYFCGGNWSTFYNIFTQIHRHASYLSIINSEKLTCFESVGSRFPPKPKYSLQKSTSIRDYMRTGFYTVSQRGFQLTFRMHDSDLTPQRVNNRNILLWFKCVLIALHVNSMILFNKGL